MASAYKVVLGDLLEKYDHIKMGKRGETFHVSLIKQSPIFVMGSGSSKTDIVEALVTAERELLANETALKNHFATKV